MGIVCPQNTHLSDIMKARFTSPVSIIYISNMVADEMNAMYSTTQKQTFSRATVQL